MTELVTSLATGDLGPPLWQIENRTNIHRRLQSTACPRCNTRQVQARSDHRWYGWQCRICRHRWNYPGVYSVELGTPDPMDVPL